MRIPSLLILTAIVLGNGAFDGLFGVPAWVFWAAGVPLIVGMLLFVLRTAILNALPERPRVAPSTCAETAREVASHLEELTALQFEAAGGALAFDLGRPVVVFPFVHRASSTYATVTHFGGSKVALDFVSLYDNETNGLTTSPEPGAGCLPLETGRFLQILPEAKSAEQLFAHHLRAAELLTARGLRPDAVVADNLPRLLAVSITKKRELFLRSTWRSTVIALVRTVTKKSPYLGALTSQPEARAWLAAHPAKGMVPAPGQSALAAASRARP